MINTVKEKHGSLKVRSGKNEEDKEQIPRNRNGWVHMSVTSALESSKGRCDNTASVTANISMFPLDRDRSFWRSF